MPDLQDHPANCIPYKCPICNGRGMVLHGFYFDDTPGETNPIDCRSCKGVGILWVMNIPTVGGASHESDWVRKLGYGYHWTT